MTFKTVFRFDPSWPKLRLFRFIWAEGTRKFAVALRPRWWKVERAWDGWRAVICGVEAHYQITHGGRFV